MIKKVILGLVAVIAILCIVVALQPADFTITRNATVAAPPNVVFEHVNDFHKWEAWSPWAKLDPNSTTTFEGAESGKGAVFKWSGNEDVGEGVQTIVESRPGETVQIDMNFIRPFEASSKVQFDFKPAGEGTEVTWSMSGENNFIGKAISLCMDCDTMVGGQFEQGLANLNEVVTPTANP